MKRHDQLAWNEGPIVTIGSLRVGTVFLASNGVRYQVVRKVSAAERRRLKGRSQSQRIQVKDFEGGSLVSMFDYAKCLKLRRDGTCG